MIAFERPHVWIAALPWLLFCIWLAWAQATALIQARRRVAPRFLARVTRYSRSSLALHLLAILALGLALLLMVAEPVRRQRPDPGGGEARVLLLIDASASMYATDVEGADGKVSRFEAARAVGRELVTTLDGARFGIVSFSGTATLHLPITSDRELVGIGLETLEAHTYYQNTGSSLAGALETVFAGDLARHELGNLARSSVKLDGCLFGRDHCCYP